MGQALKFHTEVITLESGRIVGVAWGKATAALARFCVAAAAGLGEDAGHLLYLSAAYWSSVAKHLPKAAVVFERVHLVKLVNEKLDELRRSLYRESTERRMQAKVNGTRCWLLLKLDRLGAKDEPGSTSTTNRS